MAHTTVDEVIRSLLSQEGKNTPHDYARYLDIANRGLKELTFDVLGNTKIALILVGSNMKIDLPSDYVDYVYIGTILQDGMLHPLGMKKEIPYSGGVAESAYTELDTVGGYGGRYGLGGGQNSNGYYKPDIDYDNWQMILSSVLVGTYIYLEYISDGISGTGAAVVHPYAEEALRAYIFWKSIQRVKYVSMSEKQLASTTYYNEKRLANKRLKSFTKEEALQQIRKGFKQSPKL